MLHKDPVFLGLRCNDRVPLSNFSCIFTFEMMDWKIDAVQQSSTALFPSLLCQSLSE
uniref:Uncharacterized protein n=1 Tax=Rhizophora mucronata TaxID=61149 RepID=A0A2P2LV07_RHIMU